MGDRGAGNSDPVSEVGLRDVFSLEEGEESLFHFKRKIGESQIFTNVKQKSINNKIFQAFKLERAGENRAK